MTRDVIIDKICPSDAIADCCSGECLFGCDDCSLTLGFMLDEYEKQIRTDAIEEVKDLIRHHRNYFITDGVAELFIDTELNQLKEKKNG